ncbi:FkbM family methyltransferase [Xanthobacter sp. V4C-4]|uniref:FkbM family methyltransferase n=1 Tax=Xanthobacter cornucopiae TaxID=3119924 RepID=UPI003726F1C5
MTVFADSSRFIMDLGMNSGDDTAYYLAKGFEVVALEANPLLAQAARTRFAGAIAAGRLSVVEAAVWSKAGSVTFHVNAVNDHWSSVVRALAGREGAATRAIEVEALTLGDLFDRFGTPLYLKIDVAGVDRIVIDQLTGQLIKPLYLSVEDGRSGLDHVAALAAAGYNGFQLVDRSEVPQMSDPDLPYSFPPLSAGPFGEALPDSWLEREAFEALYLSTVRDASGAPIAPPTRWFDIHAAKL